MYQIPNVWRRAGCSEAMVEEGEVAAREVLGWEVLGCIICEETFY